MSLIIPEDHQACLEAVNECFLFPQDSHWVILMKPVLNGILSTKWEFKILTNKEGFQSEILCIGHDISSLINMQEELEALIGLTSEQNKRLLNFTYVISHNIRSHLANILGIIYLNELNECEMDAKTAMGFIKKSSLSLDEAIRSLNKIISIQTITKLPLIEINVQFERKKNVESIILLMRNAGAAINYLFSNEKS